jgi:glyoxylase-like metal-dependent hydrolase (beta-lactamase superfamily II)
VDDPRLSTTYAASGLPSRTNLELWIGEGENEFPRRVAGEASAEGAVLQVEDVDLRVVPMRCHSRGREGTGVYVLATF